MNDTEKKSAPHPTREELIKRISNALETAPYINLYIACKSIEHTNPKKEGAAV